MFIDEVEIMVSSGSGGNGMVHFRREKYVPRGGPDGGNGGRGADVVLCVDPNLNTLSAFLREKQFRGKHGAHGGPSKKTGADAKELVIPVPPGTIVRASESGTLLADLVEPGQRLVVCHGGRGGRGNASYATSRNQAPRMAEKGEPGEERRLLLELRLVADVGIVGLPNAGKSTLLGALTNAQPRIGDYPFTTLQPNLGVAELDLDRRMVLADIPGLIEGAHRGVGLGHAFLRHIQRTRVLVHLIDGSSADPLADFSQLNSELALFDERLGRKVQIVALNKIDLPQVEQSWPAIRTRFRSKGQQLLAVSAKERIGTQPLLEATFKALLASSEQAETPEMPLYTPPSDPEDYSVERDLDGSLRVSGKAVERAAKMTYWEYGEAVRRFQRLLEKLGVVAALQEAGVQEGDTVRIGEFELEWQD